MHIIQTLSPVSQISLYVFLILIGLFSLLIFGWQIMILRGKAMQNPDGTTDDYQEQKAHYGIAFADIFRACPASIIAKKRMQKIAAQTQEQPLAGFVIKYVGGDGTDFDYGVDYLGCATHKFVCEQGAAEFAPYICLSDITLGDTFGWGLTHSETLADGCRKCNFRFKKGGETRISSPTS